MFVRTATRRNKDGRRAEYLKLARDRWDPATKRSKMQVLDNFGRPGRYRTVADNLQVKEVRIGPDEGSWCATTRSKAYGTPRCAS